MATGTKTIPKCSPTPMDKRCSSRSQPRPKRGAVTLAESLALQCPRGFGGDKRGGVRERNQPPAASTATGHQHHRGQDGQTRWYAPAAAKRPELRTRKPALTITNPVLTLA